MQIQQDFTLIIPINPPFADIDKQEDRFFPMVQAELYNMNTKPQFAFLKNDSNLQLPFYPAIVRKTPIQEEIEFLITGGAAYTEEGFITTNSCFKVTLTDYMNSIKVEYQVERPGKVIDGQPAKMEALIPDMLYPRHNHKLFELKAATNELVYLAVGGQYVSNEGYDFLSSCEMLVNEKIAVGPMTKLVQKWVEVAPLKNARSGFSGFVLNGKVYIFGGMSIDNQGTASLIPTSIAEVYDQTKESWTQLKFKWKLGLTNNLGALCLPISNNKVAIFGGSNGQTPTDNILIMDTDKLSVEPLKKCKMSLARAGARGVILRDRLVKTIVRTAGEETVTESKKDLIVVLLGGVGDMSFDIFWVKNWENLELELIQKEELKHQFTGDVTGTFKFFQLEDIEAWNTSLQAWPVLLY